MKILDASLGQWLCWLLGTADYLGLTPTAPTPSPTPHRILVIRPGGIGDMILLVPVLRQIATAFPSAQIDIICEKRNIEVLHMTEFSPNARAYDSGLLGTLNQLRHHHYDIAIDTEQFHNFSAIMAFLSRAPTRIGFKINPHRNLLYTHLVNYSMDGYEGEQFARLVPSTDRAYPAYKLEGSLQPPATAAPPHLQEQLATLSKTARIVTIHAASTSPYKQWDKTKFTRLASSLISQSGCSIALLGDRTEIQLVASICNELNAPTSLATSFAGKLSLAETATVIARSRLFVSADTGLAHLAIALGTPTVILFGPTDPGKWGLANARHRIVRKNLACSPCFIFGYHKLCRTIQCMSEIPEQEVLNECKAILDGN